ncbi:hypothetical protein [Nocardia altamirensis]|uniref:hypothetical protein n=1 Tax=Nocardia altamirensis TaxID=472158 RepID=UPI0008401837|nr:hypothetical protein [Nocardia altamirensis]
MWEWSKAVAEHAAAAAWTSWQPIETEPKFLDPESWTEADQGDDDAADRTSVLIMGYVLVG